MNNNKFVAKSYSHFDNKKQYEKCKKRVENREYIKRHAFYPFIYFEKEIVKFNKRKNEDFTKLESKKRKLFYSAHIDRYIYQYYGMELNDLYNKKALELGIDDVSLAYRTNKKGLCNINFSKEIFDYISKQEECYIFVADFSKYFDTLDHKYLKSRLKDLFRDKSIPGEHYAIYKNMCKYCYIDLNDILKVKNKSVKNINKLERIFEIKEFRDFKKNNKKVNEESYGIPQGSAISAIYSNVYLMEFDQKMKAYANKQDGIYRRYCDDIIIVIPNKEREVQLHELKINMFKVKKDVSNIIMQIPQLKINLKKIQSLFFDKNNNIYDNSKQKTKLDYLGFVYDGDSVKIREKSITKYYYKSKRSINFINKFSSKKKRNCLRKKLYNSYSHLGVSRGSDGIIKTYTYKNGKIKYGNFITYAYRAQQIFDIDGCTKNEMKKQVRKHWRYIYKELDDYSVDVQLKMKI